MTTKVTHRQEERGTTTRTPGEAVLGELALSGLHLIETRQSNRQLESSPGILAEKAAQPREARRGAEEIRAKGYDLVEPLSASEELPEGNSNSLTGRGEATKIHAAPGTFSPAEHRLG